MYENQNLRVCDFCDERFQANPFTRTVGDEVFLYCSNNCLHDHRKHQSTQKELQGKLYQRDPRGWDVT